jgi:hypothetical protein
MFIDCCGTTDNPQKLADAKIKKKKDTLHSISSQDYKTSQEIT